MKKKKVKKKMKNSWLFEKSADWKTKLGFYIYFYIIGIFCIGGIVLAIYV